MENRYSDGGLLINWSYWSEMYLYECDKQTRKKMGKEESWFDCKNDGSITS